MPTTKPKSPKPLPSVHLLGSGTPMCAGCGGLETVHEIYDLLGAKTVFVNAAGCLTLLATYPFTPFRGSWLYTAMASAPAGAQGVRDALDVLLAKGRIPPEEDLEVVVLTGDGAAYGMGLSATSSAIERGLNFLYICTTTRATATPGSSSPRPRPTPPGPPPACGASRAIRKISLPSGRRTSRCTPRRPWAPNPWTWLRKLTRPKTSKDRD